MSAVADPTVRVTQYEVNAYPGDDINASLYAITVEYRGLGRWAACRSRQCLGKRGQWSWESNPSSRTDRWLKAYRHDLDTALALAKKAAPKVVVNGMTPAQCWEWAEARRAPGGGQC